MHPPADAHLVDRRALMAATVGMFVVTMSPTARATPAEMAEAIRAFTGGAPIVAGRVRLDIPPLTENGNAVPLSVTVESPMTPGDHVTAIAVFNEKNPQPHVATATFGPRAGRAGFQTRIRLADSQTVTAIARMSDGRFFSDSADVVVTLAACLEGLTMAALLNVPKTARPGEIIEIKTLMSHPMVTGYGRDDEGRPMARDIIRYFTCRYDGEEVFRIELTQAIASNPFIVFSTVATRSGTLLFEWSDEKGETWRETAELTVA